MLKRYKKSTLRIRKDQVLFSSSLGLLLLLTLAILFPMVPSSSNAAETGTSPTSTTRNTELNASVRPVISVSVPASLSLEVVPDNASGNFVYQEDNLVVTTNNASGFRVLLSTNGTTDLVSRNNTSSETISSITAPTLSSNFENNTWGYYLGISSVDSTTTYQPISTTSLEAIKSGTIVDTASSMTYKLAFGAKIDPTLPAGVYSNTMMISAVANPMEITSLLDLTFMQDMSSEICDSTPSAFIPTGSSIVPSGTNYFNVTGGTVDRDSPYYLEPVTKQLYDIRDGNMYWVAKLADGNCWMTQNLALNLGERPIDAPASYSRYVKTLTPGDSDVTSEWTVPVSTTKYKVYDNPTNPMEPLDPEHPENTPIIEKTETITGTEVAIPRLDIGAISSLRSWNLGEIVLTNPTTSDICHGTLPSAMASLGYTNDQWNSAYATQKLEDVCLNTVGGADKLVYKDVSGLEPSSNPYWKTPTNAIDETTNEYDAHYLLGNYYSWQAATTQSELVTSTVTNDGKDIVLKNATGSICPKGWTMSTSAHTFQKNSGGQFESFAVLNLEDSFYRLLESYSYPVNTDISLTPSASKWVINNYNNIFTNITAGDERVRLDYAPMYFARSGNVSAGRGALLFGGYEGDVWASTIIPHLSNVQASEMNFLTNIVYPSRPYGTAVGFSVRCIAR